MIFNTITKFCKIFGKKIQVAQNVRLNLVQVAHFVQFMFFHFIFYFFKYTHDILENFNGNEVYYSTRFITNSQFKSVDKLYA